MKKIKKPKYKVYEKGQGLFLCITPSKQFNKYSLEKIVDRFIEENLDISAFDENYNNENTGRHAYDPMSVLKVILFSFAQGQTSTRKIEELLDYHLSYIYLSGNQHFDHSTIARFCTVHSNAIKDVFSQLLCLLQKFGLIDWDEIEIDSTIVSGNASKSVTGNMSDFEILRDRCNRYSNKLVDRAKKLTKEKYSAEYIKDENRKIERQEKKYKNIVKKINEHEESIKKGEASSIEKKNLTDDYTSLLKTRDKDGYVQGFNSFCSFSKNDILLDIYGNKNATNKFSSVFYVTKFQSLMHSFLEKHKSKFLMDKGFFSIEGITSLLKNGDDIYIPIPNNVKERNIISKDGNFYLEHKGKLLLGYLNNNKKCKHYRFYYHENGKRKYIFVMSDVVENNELWQKYYEKMNSEKGKSIYAKRIGKEHNHHTLKEIGGMRRIHRRGKDRINLEMTIHGIAYNLKKLAKGLRANPSLLEKFST